MVAVAFAILWYNGQLARLRKYCEETQRRIEEMHLAYVERTERFDGGGDDLDPPSGRIHHGGGCGIRLFSARNNVNCPNIIL